MCPNCQHEDHEPGRCKRDNCGESEISHTTSYREVTRVGGDGIHQSSVISAAYDMGHKVPERRRCE